MWDVHIGHNWQTSHKVASDERSQHNRTLARREALSRIAIKMNWYQHNRHLRQTAIAARLPQYFIGQIVCFPQRCNDVHRQVGRRDVGDWFANSFAEHITDSIDIVTHARYYARVCK